MQRAAIARAIIHRPALLVADEPTGNLDSANGATILDLLVELQRETGVALLLATHAEDVAAVADRIVRMRDGASSARIASAAAGAGGVPQRRRRALPALIACASSAS